MFVKPGTTSRLGLVLLAGTIMTACATPHPKLSNRFPPASQPLPAPGAVYKVGAPYQVGGIWYVPREEPNYDHTGLASWYGDDFDHKPTANGETFDMNAISGAHPTLPLPSIVEVTNLDNGRKLTVRINDRGPFVGGRIVDLSHAGARALGFNGQGLANVRVRYVGPAALPRAEVRFVEDTPIRTAARAPSLEVSTPAAPSSPVVSLPQPLPTATPRLAAPQVTNAQADPSRVVGQPRPQDAVVPASPVIHSALAPLFRVQAGAFTDPANAQRVASRLAIAGSPVIETVQRNGATLYRVLVQGTANEQEALALRQRVAELGYEDARVIRPN